MQSHGRRGHVVYRHRSSIGSAPPASGGRGAAAAVVRSPGAAIALSVVFAEIAAVGGIVLSLAPGLPVSAFVTTISFLIYLACRMIGRRRVYRTR